MKKLDLVGKRFGRLLVISEVIERKNGYINWECKCDCGNTRFVRTCSLRSGASPSCGCISRERIKQLKLLPFGQAAFNSLFCSYKGSARKRGYSFSLTKEEFETITKMPCHYCGIVPSTEYKNYDSESGGSYFYNGIDRVDNSIGYEANNVVPCCTTCNIAKGTKTSDEFKDWIRTAYRHISGLV